MRPLFGLGGRRLTACLLGGLPCCDLAFGVGLVLLCLSFGLERLPFTGNVAELPD